MTEVTVNFSTIENSAAALGVAGERTVIADRPKGKAGGMGLGFNGAELLALALGGCFSNDLRYVAEAQGKELNDIDVQVTLELGGTPLVVTAARLSASCTTKDGSDPAPIIAAARQSCMVSNTLARGVTVSFATD